VTDVFYPAYAERLPAVATMLFAHAAAFDFTRSPRREPPVLPTPPSIVSQPCGAVSVPRS
jgi:hypothetical protein